MGRTGQNHVSVYTWCIHGMFCRDFIKYTSWRRMYYIQFWPTQLVGLRLAQNCNCSMGNSVLVLLCAAGTCCKSQSGEGAAFWRCKRGRTAVVKLIILRPAFIGCHAPTPLRPRASCKLWEVCAASVRSWGRFSAGICPPVYARDCEKWAKWWACVVC
jgi:hypothetical protein